MRGYCGIGIAGSKTAVNVGTLWRSAAMLDAQFIFTIGRRWPDQASDTVKAQRHVPFFEYLNGEEFFDHGIPKDCVPVAVELDPRARPIEHYNHPERAVYILGAEDNGIPERIMNRCRDIIVLPGPRSLNVATAGSIVLYDRLAKQARALRVAA